MLLKLSPPVVKISGSKSFTRWLAPGSELGASWSEGSETNVILGFRVPTTIGLRKPPAGSPCSQLAPVAPRASLGPWSLWGGARDYGQGGSKLKLAHLPPSTLPLLQLALSSLQPPSSLPALSSLPPCSPGYSSLPAFSQLSPASQFAPSFLQPPNSLQLAPLAPAHSLLAPSSLQPPSLLQLAPSSLQLIPLAPACSKLYPASQLTPACSPCSSLLPACSPHSSLLPLFQLTPTLLQLTPLAPAHSQLAPARSPHSSLLPARSPCSSSLPAHSPHSSSLPARSPRSSSLLLLPACSSLLPACSQWSKVFSMFLGSPPPLGGQGARERAGSELEWAGSNWSQLGVSLEQAGSNWSELGVSWSEQSEQNVILGFRAPTTSGWSELEAS